MQKLLDKKIDIKTVKLFLDQAISAQLLAFQHYGFVHFIKNLKIFYKK